MTPPISIERSIAAVTSLIDWSATAGEADLHAALCERLDGLMRERNRAIATERAAPGRSNE